jgi:coniferyl-aldehyde dehydrogenase
MTNTITNPTELADALGAMRAAWQANVPSYEQRMDDLANLQQALIAHKQALVDAVAADFTRRSRHETLLTDVMTVLDEVKHARQHLRRWMKPKRAPIDLKAWPASGEIQQRALGVVGVIAPWNYPIQLSLSPLLMAIAAGNHVMLKPSEHTPRTSALLANLLAKVFPATRVQVALGDADMAGAFSNLPFDHLFYTGSTPVGRLVMAAAAKNLTPVTLELGGKSPCLIAPDFPIEHAAKRVAAMKWLNAGQTCIAPDYVLVAEHRLEAFKSAITSVIEKSYPGLADNPDYTSVINQRQRQRLESYLVDAKGKGAQVQSICPGGAVHGDSNVMAPTLVWNTSPEMKVMQDEIFGPILPIVSYRSIEEALAVVHRLDRPLAFYLFDHQKQRTEHILGQVLAGGVTVNDCALHFTQHSMPFGGVGASGMGHYHGHSGFLTFTKQMPVFRQARWSGFWYLTPPFKKLADRAVEFLTRG